MFPGLHVACSALRCPCCLHLLYKCAGHRVTQEGPSGLQADVLGVPSGVSWGSRRLEFARLKARLYVCRVHLVFPRGEVRPLYRLHPACPAQASALFAPQQEGVV